MKTKITVILLLITLLLLGVSVFSFISKDTESPVITLPEAEITYMAGSDQSILLAGVTAYDEEDGDLSDKVRIYDIAILADGVRAQVTYAVYDDSYNLGKASCIVNYVASDSKQQNKEEIKEEPKEEVKEEVTEASTEEVTEEELEEGYEDVPLESEGDPVIRLVTHQVHIETGGRFNALSYVDEVVDDEDSREYLYRNIHIDGSYNVNSEGEYELTYYCMDSDGNESNKAKLKLIVGEEPTEEESEE